YSSRYAMLNAKDFGIPQNRSRCFMVSHLGGAVPDFPQGFPLGKRLGDVLEENVPARYYLSQKMIDGLVFHKKMQESKGNGFGFSPVTRDGIAHAVTTGEGFHNNSTYLLTGRCVQVADLNRPGYLDCVNRVYSPAGCSPAITTCQGGDRQPKILIRNNTAQGYLEAHPGDGVVLDRPESMTKRGQVRVGCSPTLTTGSQIGAIHADGGDYSVRRLTPRECWRLMGFPDSVFDAARAARMSDTQLYRQAGNSIAVPVLSAVFRQMFADTGSCAQSSLDRWGPEHR
ncbi:MAG: DNA cytosine methyltransferase, partial [Candidatus Methanomethylophilaceae archaeon]